MMDIVAVSLCSILLILSVLSPGCYGIVNIAPTQRKITTHLQDQDTEAGNSVTFTCNATGASSISYQWFHNDVAIPSAVTTTYTFTASHSSFGSYHCNATSGSDEVASNSATLTVAPYNATITTQIVGNDVIYTCTVDGGPSNTFIWTRSGDNSPVSTTSVLTLDGTDPSNYDTYICTIENAAGDNSTMITLDATTANVGNDPHFFLPLPNGDNLCFSVQGQPDFMFSLIKDRYVQLNTQFVLPAEDESHTIANVSTFLGNLGLLLRSPVTGNTTAIKVSAKDHTVLVDGSVITVKNKPVIVQVSNTFIVDITVDVNQQVHTIKDGSAWLYIYTEFGFGIKVRFYKKHLDLFLTKTSGLTNEAHGIIGQFLNSNVEVDNENNLLKFGNRKPISVRKGPAWPYLHINEDCWYGTATDNQGTGVIEGNYMDYIVQELIS